MLVIKETNELVRYATGPEELGTVQYVRLPEGVVVECVVVKV